MAKGSRVCQLCLCRASTCNGNQSSPSKGASTTWGTGEMAGLAARRCLIATLLAGRTPACTAVARPSLAKKASGPAFRKCRAKFSNSCRPSPSLRLPTVFAPRWLQGRRVPCGPASHCGPHQIHQRQPESVVGKGGSASWAVSCSTCCLQQQHELSQLANLGIEGSAQSEGSAAWGLRMPSSHTHTSKE